VARTPEGALLTQQHRLAQLALRAALLRDLALLWPLFDVTEFATFDAFVAAAEVLLRARHADSAGLASSYLATFRAIEGVDGTLRRALPAPLDPDVIRSSLRGAGLLGTLNARRAGLPPEAARRNGFVRVAGASGSLVLAGGRRALLEGMARDPARPRWQRVTSSRPCAFCAMLATRGPAYRSQAGADFQAHDHCSCTPEPAYDGSQLPAVSRRLREQWSESTAGLSGTDALNAFRRVVEEREEVSSAGDRVA
jgi:hypothetical protein